MGWLEWKWQHDSSWLHLLDSISSRIFWIALSPKVLRGTLFNFFYFLRGLRNLVDSEEWWSSPWYPSGYHLPWYPSGYHLPFINFILSPHHVVAVVLKDFELRVMECSCLGLLKYWEWFSYEVVVEVVFDFPIFGFLASSFPLAFAVFAFDFWIWILFWH